MPCWNNNSQSSDTDAKPSHNPELAGGSKSRTMEWISFYSNLHRPKMLLDWKQNRTSGKGLKSYLIPTSLSWAGTLSTTPGCSEFHPARPFSKIPRPQFPHAEQKGPQLTLTQDKIQPFRLRVHFFITDLQVEENLNLNPHLQHTQPPAESTLTCL